MFLFPDPHNKPSPCAILICYVDDFLLTYNKNFPLQKFIDTFRWGSKQNLEPGKPLVFKGKEITLDDSGKTSVLHVTQKTFIENLDDPKVSTHGKKNQTLDDAVAFWTVPP